MTTMNAGALSFLTSLETPTKVSFSAEFSAEGDTGDGAAKGAFDGFANLLDQLVQIAPVEGTVPSVSAEMAETLDMLPATDAESGKDGGSESGNILPVGLPGLLPLQLFTPAGDASAGNTGTVAELPVGRLDMARLAKPVAMPLEASVSVHSALVQNPGQTVAQDAAQAMTVARALPDAASIGQIPAGEAQLSRALASLVEAKGAAPATVGATQALAGLAQSVANAPASAAAMPGAALDRAPIAAITIAARPTTTVAVSARIEAGSSEAAAQAVATVLPANAVKADAKPAPAAQAAAIAPDTASETEAEPDTARPVEAVQASARVSASAETIRSEPATAAPAAQAAAAPRAEAVTRAADLARPDAFAAIDSIARMVDRLSAARDFGVVPTAALAVMHKEFGELSIAIDRISDTLQVEVAAKDGEAQRALAAALANERAAAMAGDRGVQRSAEAQQNMGQNGGQNTGQNGAQTNGQGANGSAADMFGQAASGNAQSNRDGQGRERTRPDGQPLHAQNSAASDRQPAGDDGRYA